MLHQDPYVRKTAAVCVAKLYDINAELVEDQGFLQVLRDLICDPNPTVRQTHRHDQSHELERSNRKEGRTQCTPTALHYGVMIYLSTDWLIGWCRGAMFCKTLMCCCTYCACYKLRCAMSSSYIFEMCFVQLLWWL